MSEELCEPTREMFLFNHQFSGRSYRQLKKSLRGLRDIHIGERCQGVPHGRDHPLLEQGHHYIDSDHNFQNALQQESLSNPRSAWEVQFIAESGCKEEVQQVLDV